MSLSTLNNELQALRVLVIQAIEECDSAVQRRELGEVLVNTMSLEVLTQRSTGVDAADRKMISEIGSFIDVSRAWIADLNGK